MIFNKLLKKHPKNNSVLVVYAYLIGVCDDKGNISVSQRKMAVDTGLSRRQVQFSIDILIHENLIEILDIVYTIHLVEYDTMPKEIRLCLNLVDDRKKKDPESDSKADVVKKDETKEKKAPEEIEELELVNETIHQPQQNPQTLFKDEIEAEFSRFNEWVDKECPSIRKVQYQLTLENYKNIRLKLGYSKEEIVAAINNLHNWVDFPKKRRTINLSLQEELKKQRQNGRNRSDNGIHRTRSEREQQLLLDVLNGIKKDSEDTFVPPIL